MYNVSSYEVPMTYLAWFIFIAAAILEVAGDAVIREGLRGSSLVAIAIGCTLLGCYGVVVNTVGFFETARSLRSHLCTGQRIVRTICI